MKEFKYFLLTDYEEEEVYLRERHKQGYKLVHVSLPGRYTFVECTPEDYVYRLDFNPQNAKEKHLIFRCLKTMDGNIFRI